MATAPKLDHSIDGIEEYDNPLPSWWLYGFYLTIAWAFVYAVMYPSTWFWQGTQKWSQDGQWTQEMTVANATYPKPTLESEAAKMPKLATDPAVLASGGELFRKNCAVCHGANAEGKIGPCLTDDTWLYGGDPKDILTTVYDGRPKGMPTWRKVLGEKRCLEVATYVYSLTHK